MQAKNAFINYSYERIDGKLDGRCIRVLLLMRFSWPNVNHQKKKKHPAFLQTKTQLLAHIDVCVRIFILNIGKIFTILILKNAC